MRGKEERHKCGECGKAIGGHNKYLHDSMCDGCFNKKYFPNADPRKDPLSERNSRGKCGLCGEEFAGMSIRAHLKSCLGKLRGGHPAFVLKASAGPFWVYFSADVNSTLKDVDGFLRELWLECCGHLSSFEIGKQVYFSEPSELEPGEKTMEAPVEKALKGVSKFSHKYDFGTTTNLLLEVVCEIEEGPAKVMILARNALPPFKCSECGKPAEEVCVQCVWSSLEDGCFCKSCAKKHDCMEPAFLPIANSPRIGMCGFTGEECALINS